MASSPLLPARRQRRTRREPGPDAIAAAWMRAARVLEVRSRRESSGPFTGSYRSAFRGGGVEFEESRAYVPGDDVRAIDWNVLARTGVPFVKRFREERDQGVELVLDVSGSMRFGSGPGAGLGGGAKATAAAHAGALVAAAAARAGDRVGLLTFDEDVREVIPTARGEAHARTVVHRLVEAPAAAGGGTGLGRALAHVRRRTRRRSLVVLLSDFRDETFFEPGVPGRPPPRADLVALARAHDVVAVVIRDPREETIPAAGSVRVADPERPGRTLLLRSGRRRARERYRAAAEVRQRALVWRLRADGCEVLALRTDQDPLRAWLRLFARRAGARGVTREGR